MSSGKLLSMLKLDYFIADSSLLDSYLHSELFYSTDELFNIRKRTLPYPLSGLCKRGSRVYTELVDTARYGSSAPSSDHLCRDDRTELEVRAEESGERGLEGGLVDKDLNALRRHQRDVWPAVGVQISTRERSHALQRCRRRSERPA
jgi:hypothetical protein